MKTLILCVDRDDDLGSKASVETPVVGRRRTLEAATALGVTDPEDSDTNALFAAVRLYDRELQRSRGEAGQVEVAAIAGHRIVGIKSDRLLAAQLEEVLDVTQADEVVLVSDGAEDEQILPILTSRVKVAHVHRSIVKQAPRLEGLYFVLTRMLDDPKLAKRYVLPLGLIFLVWGIAFLLDLEDTAGGLTLGIIGGWLLVHAMKWEQKVGRFLRDVAEGMRTGKVTLVANIVMIVLLVVGVVQAIDRVPDNAESNTQRVLWFMESFLLYFVSALLVRTAGQLFDAWFRQGQPGFGHWAAAFSLIAFGFIGTAVLDFIIGMQTGESIAGVLDFEFVFLVLAGLAVAMGGFILQKYLRTFVEEAQPGP